MCQTFSQGIAAIIYFQRALLPIYTLSHCLWILPWIVEETSINDIGKYKEAVELQYFLSNHNIFICNLHCKVKIEPFWCTRYSELSVCIFNPHTFAQSEELLSHSVKETQTNDVGIIKK